MNPCSNQQDRVSSKLKFWLCKFTHHKRSDKLRPTAGIETTSSVVANDTLFVQRSFNPDFLRQERNNGFSSKKSLGNSHSSSGMVVEALEAHRENKNVC